MKRMGYSGRLFRQFVGFARQHGVYWIVPLILLLALAGFAIAASNVASPLIYAIF